MLESTKHTDVTKATSDATALQESPGGRRPEGGEGRAVASVGADAPNPEVKPKKQRRNFTSAYKLKILDLADACSKDGDIGALLRKEGLYSSHLSKWRQQKQQGILYGLSKKRGVKPKEDQEMLLAYKKLQAENNKLKDKLSEAEIIIEFQKKTSALLNLLNQKDEKK